MKTLKLLLFTASVACWLTACDDPQDLNFNSEESSANFNLQAKSSKPVEVPFKANLFTSQGEDAFSVICSVNSSTDFWALEHQVGGGNATHLGNFTTDLKFCFHYVLDDQGIPNAEGGFGEYGEVTGYMQSANGDLLYVTSPGSRLIPIENELHDFEFEDIFTINGGTGRFENASGEVNVNSLVRRDRTGTEHNWAGTIILK